MENLSSRVISSPCSHPTLTAFSPSQKMEAADDWPSVSLYSEASFIRQWNWQQTQSETGASCRDMYILPPCFIGSMHCSLCNTLHIYACFKMWHCTCFFMLAFAWASACIRAGWTASFNNTFLEISTSFVEAIKAKVGNRSIAIY